ncbi:uncharacterized protein LOC133914599 [Phragmites australis]|uniref:uncharacterized protein LOC133914599 n=1 Tax=Phragmites australis TaxID=29695 RepID=UPI002D773656|nr:uncharacterized protein LOC133914599 [Phragmites australis]
MAWVAVAFLWMMQRTGAAEKGDKVTASWSFRGAKGTAATALLLVLIAECACVAEPRYEPDDVHLYFKLSTQQRNELYEPLRRELVDNKPRMVVAGHVYLAPKDARPRSPPARWIKLHLVGETDEDRCTLAFGDSDIYLLAFQNKTEDWNAFPGYDTLFPKGRNLSFSESYTSLVGGFDRLYTVPLGKPAALRAVKVLSGYNPDTTPDSEAKVAAATFMVMIAEALRFKPIREAFSKDWESETFLSKAQSKYVVHWGAISYLLWKWERTGNWEGSEAKGARRIGVTNAAQALEMLDLLKRPRDLCINSTLSK